MSVMTSQLSTYVCAALAVLTTIPAVIRLASTISSPSRDPNPCQLYCDKDGVTTEKSQNDFSDRSLRVAIVTVTVVGLAVSLTAAILATRARPAESLGLWLLLFTWCAGCFQNVTIFIESSSAKKVTLGVYGAVMNIVLVSALMKLIAISKSSTLLSYLQVAQAILAAGLAVTLVSIPRRPDVFHNGTVVDRQYTTSLLARYSFAWAPQVLDVVKRLGHPGAENLPVLDDSLRTKTPGAKLPAKAGDQPLWRVILTAHLAKFLVQWTGVLIMCLLQFLPQLVLLRILRSFEQDGQDQGNNRSLWKWVAALGLSVAGSTCVENFINWWSTVNIGLAVYQQVAATIVAKGLRKKDVKSVDKAKSKQDHLDLLTEPLQPPQKKEAANERSTQNTINLLAVDAKRISDFALLNHRIIQCTGKVLISIVFVARLVGIQSLVAGICASLLTIPINLILAGRYSHSQRVLMKARDAKLSTVTEAVQGIRQIKFSALEQQWSRTIMERRSQELRAQYLTYMYKVALMFVSLLGPAMLSITTLGTYALLEGQLTASIAFTTISVFNSVDTTIEKFPDLATKFVNARLSLGRIEKYLNSADKHTLIQPSSTIIFENTTVAWPADDGDQRCSDAFALRHVNLEFPDKELSIITGKVGSGKTLLLASIMGEADILDGFIKAPRWSNCDRQLSNQSDWNEWVSDTTVAYVAQIPWIENATIKDNILFGLPMKCDRYQKVIYACALERDLDLLPLRDDTDIGANGVNLSGGQKWRLSLARALYSRAGVLLMDDIFSAVDTKVGQHLYEHALTGELAMGRTRILVTHHLSLCGAAAKYVVSLGGGDVEVSDAEVVMTEDEISNKLEDESTEEADHDALSEMTVVADSTGMPTAPELERLGDSRNALNQAVPFMTDELIATTTVGGRAYFQYTKATGYLWTGLICTSFGLFAALSLGRMLWVSIWTRSNHNEVTQLFMTSGLAFQQTLHHTTSTTSSVFAHDAVRYYLGIYAGLWLLACTVGASRYFLLFTGAIRVSRNLFDKAIYNVLRMPLRWLDTVPLGQILNRFTSDFEIIDSNIAEVYCYVLMNICFMAGSVFAAAVVSYYIVLIVVLTLVVCLYYARQYIIGAREVKRLEGTLRSPIFERFGSILTGLDTIRAMGRSNAYLSLMNQHIDEWSRAAFYLELFVRWFTFRLNVVSALLVTSVAAILVVVPGVDAALVGFCLNFVLKFSQTVIYGVQDCASLDMAMNAVERVAGYCELEPEDQSGLDVPAAWPTNGRIEVDKLVVSYAPEMTSVLRGITFTAEPHQRIGVVGRTGAGKSSLALALFRFLHTKSGTVTIDGVDTSKIKLHTLRSRVAIISQDPVLFSGTVRSNLDPFDEYEDIDLYNTLQRVNLVETDLPKAHTVSGDVARDVNANPDIQAKNTSVSNDPYTFLYAPISAGGLNLSQGQRQLVHLARALLTRPKILVLDEATSALDKGTDMLIQRSIREEFQSSTLIVIAHRLSTIADFDKVLVLDEGRVVEFDEPRVLLGREGGMFRAMVEVSDDKEGIERLAGTRV